MFFVGIGGSTRAGSSTEVLVQAVLDALERRGATTTLYGGPALMLPPYEQTLVCSEAGAAIIADVRRGDGLVVGSPG